MVRKVLTTNQDYHSGIIKKTIVIDAQPEKIWKEISNLTSVKWLSKIKNGSYVSKNKKGLGTIRRLAFKDGSVIEEHIVGWKNGESFSYIAVSGLPLRGYHATITLRFQKNKKTRVSWESFLSSEKMPLSKFVEFLSFIENFYANSLSNLKLLFKSE